MSYAYGYKESLNNMIKQVSKPDLASKRTEVTTVETTIHKTFESQKDSVKDKNNLTSLNSMKPPRLEQFKNYPSSAAGVPRLFNRHLANNSSKEGVKSVPDVISMSMDRNTTTKLAANVQQRMHSSTNEGQKHGMDKYQIGKEIG